MRRGLYVLTVLVFFAGSAQAFGPSADRTPRGFAGADPSETAVYGEQDERPDMTFKKSSADGVYAGWRGDAWRNIVIAVKNGQVTPFELAEIRRRSEHENAEAIELLAWMYATGTGISQDLPKSYAYYMHAAQLGVPSAYKNVRVVYQAMSPSQREILPSY